MRRYIDSVRIAQLLAKLVLQSISQQEKEELSKLVKKTGIKPEEIIKNFSGQKTISSEEERGRIIWQSLEKQISDKQYSFRRKFMRYAAIIVTLLTLSVTGYYVRNKGVIEEPSISLLANKTVLEYKGGEKLLLSDETNISEILKSNQILDQTETEIKIAEIFKIKVSSGSTHTVILQDSTRVILYPESELQFPSFFDGSERVVKLTGEGYFEVTKDPSRLFRVEANQASIVVYGTSFNVRAYEHESNIETSLVSGKVSVNETLLTPNQMAVFNKETSMMEIRHVEARIYEERAGGLFVFENRNLEEIMQEFSLWYGIEYKYSDSTLKDKRFRFRLPRSSSFNYLMKLMQETGELEFEVYENSINIMPGKL